MIHIRKGQEPQSLIAYRKTPGATYEGYRAKDDVRRALLRDQGYLCAYCMRRISIQEMKIEHWKAQKSSDGTGERYALDYRNMLGVCDGNQGAPHEMQTCDTYRGNADLYVDPREESHIQRIEYLTDGTIRSMDSRIDQDLNQRLNLNCAQSYLKENRKAAITTLQAFLREEQNKGLWRTETLIKARHHFEALKNGEFPRYLGVILYFIDKYLKIAQKKSS